MTDEGAPAGLRIHDQDLGGEGDELISRNPADGSVVFRGFQGSAAQASLAVAAATAVQSSWESTPWEMRVAVARRFADLVASDRQGLADLISREVGKLPSDAAGEVSAVIAKVEVSIEAHLRRRANEDEEMPPISAKPSSQRLGQTTQPEPVAITSQTRFRAIGPVVVLGPYNFPAHLPCGQLIPAILAGNAVIFKPSELAPAVGRWVVDRWLAAGLPAGVLNLVQGGAAVARSLVDDPRIGGVFFTGGYQTGQSIHRRLAGRPEVLLALEMGGNNPLVIASPEAPDAAAEMVFQSAIATSGQRCTCVRRLIVIDNGSGRATVASLIRRIEAAIYGVASDRPEPEIGPLVNSTAVERLQKVQAEWIAAGGKLVCRLEPIAYATGAWGPTLVRCGLVDVTQCGVLADDEWFGPLIQLHFVADFEQAIGLAGATRFGLAAGLIGGTEAMFDRFRQAVRAGVVNWNRPLTGASSRLPFGGLGHSGNHRAAGAYASDFCSDPVASLISPLCRPTRQ